MVVGTQEQKEALGEVQGEGKGGGAQVSRRGTERRRQNGRSKAPVVPSDCGPPVSRREPSGAAARRCECNSETCQRAGFSGA